MRHRVEVRQGAQHQNRHAAIEAVERVVRVVEEKDIAQAQGHPRHRQGQQAEQLEQRGQRPRLWRAQAQPGVEKHQHGARQHGQARQAQGVEITAPTVADQAAELVVVQAQVEVVRPVSDQRGVDGHADHRADKAQGRQQQGRAPQIAQPVDLGLPGHRAGGQGGGLAALHPAVGEERQQGRQQ